VAVRVLTDDRQAEGAGSRVGQLRSAGIAVQTDISGERKIGVRQVSGLPTLFDERVLDVDGPVVVGCLQRELASDLRLGRAILWAAP